MKKKKKQVEMLIPKKITKRKRKRKIGKRKIKK